MSDPVHLFEELHEVKALQKEINQLLSVYKDSQGFDPLNIGHVGRFAGMNVHEEQTPPKIQLRDIKLSDGTPLVSPEFRAEMNAWLAARFGYRESMIPRDRFLLTQWGLHIRTDQRAILANITA